MSTRTSSLSTRTTMPSRTSPCLRFLIGIPAPASNSSMVVGSGPVHTRGAGAAAGAATGASVATGADSAGAPSARSTAGVSTGSDALTLTLFGFAGAFALRTGATAPASAPASISAAPGVSSSFKLVVLLTTYSRSGGDAASRCRWRNLTIAFGEPTTALRTRPAPTGASAPARARSYRRGPQCC